MAGKGAAGAAGKAGEDDGKAGAAGEGTGTGDGSGTGAAAGAGAAGADEGSGTAAGAASAAAGSEEKSYTKTEFERELAKQKKEFEKSAAKEKERADLSEQERLKAQLEDTQTQLRMRDAKDDVMAALEKEGARSASLMWNAIRGELEFDDKGKLSNLKDLITGLKADYADQFGEPKPAETIDGGAGQQVAGTKLTQEAIAKMTPAEINANWEEVKKVLAAA